VPSKEANGFQRSAISIYSFFESFDKTGKHTFYFGNFFVGFSVQLVIQII